MGLFSSSRSASTETTQVTNQSANLGFSELEDVGGGIVSPSVQTGRGGKSNVAVRVEQTDFGAVQAGVGAAREAASDSLQLSGDLVGEGFQFADNAVRINADLARDLTARNAETVDVLTTRTTDAVQETGRQFVASLSGLKKTQEGLSERLALLGGAVVLTVAGVMALRARKA